MGLTLHYELRLPAETSAEVVDARLRALRAFATTLHLAEVSPVMHAAEGDVTDPPRDAVALQFYASTVAEPIAEGVPVLFGDESSARGFLLMPGEGCETAALGFLMRESADCALREWYWRGFCKTQYASVVSEAHFINCHVALVRLLDRAKSLGIDVVVHDEGHYWETRDEQRLVADLRHMNHIVAALAGGLRDKLGDAHPIEAPIFDHRRFEHLEMGEVDDSDAE